MQSVLGGDQFLGRDSQCLGGADQIGFVVGEKFEGGSEDRRIAQSGAQRFGIKAGKFKIARRTLLALQHPAERRQRQNLRLRRLGCGVMRDCSVLREGIVG